MDFDLYFKFRLRAKIGQHTWKRVGKWLRSLIWLIIIALIASFHTFSVPLRPPCETGTPPQFPSSSASLPVEISRVRAVQSALRFAHGLDSLHRKGIPLRS